MNPLTDTEKYNYSDEKGFTPEIQNKKTPRVHAELIKAWADGAEIEVFDFTNTVWIPVPSPAWSPNSKYRIKPQNVVRYGAWFPKQQKLYCYNERKRSTDTVKITLNPDQTKIIAIELLPDEE